MGQVVFMESRIRGFEPKVLADFCRVKQIGTYLRVTLAALMRQKAQQVTGAQYVGGIDYFLLLPGRLKQPRTFQNMQMRS